MSKILIIVCVLALLLPLEVLHSEIVQIGDGNLTGKCLPIEPYMRYSYSQSVFLNTEIGYSGVITAISYQYTISSASFLSNTNQFSIYLGVVNRNNFQTLTDWVPIDSLQHVFQGDLQAQWFSSALPGQGWVTIPLTTAFAYNGADNLIVAVDENNQGYTTTGDDFRCTASALPMSLEIHSMTVNPDPISPPPAYNSDPYNPLSVRPNIKIDIQPVIYAPHSPNPLNNATEVPIAPNLSWMSDADYWDVYLAPLNQPLQLVAEALSEPSWTVGNNLSLLTTYQWQIVSHTASNDYTGSIWTFTTAGEVMSAPQNLQVMSVQNTVHLAWDAPVNGSVVSYRIYRNNQLIEEVQSCAYIDTSVLWNQTYYYYIVAVNYLNQVSPPSSTVSITMPGALPVWQMDFEDQADFSTTITNWTTYDLDNSNTWSFNEINFPNEGTPLSWIVFNPSQTTPPINTITPFSGQKMMLCIDSTSPPNNDWLISPELSIQSGYKLNFWARSWSADYGLERLKILVSTTDNNPNSFTPISAEPWINVPAEWTRFEHSLSEYSGQNIYIAWQCVSWDALALALDNVNLTQNVDSQDDYLLAKDNIMLYPNPAAKHFTIQCKDITAFDLQIFDIKGRLVLTQDNLFSYNWNYADSVKLASGIYLVKISQNNKVSTKRLVIY